jgi:3-oxoadipate enol-lactonase
MTHIDLKDMRLHYVLEGAADAPVLVLSNSLGTDLTMWNPQIPEFVKQFRVLRYDTRGHGQSSAPPGSYSITQLAQDVLDLLNKLKIEQCFFCGLSMGGMIGQWLGVHAGERLCKLVLANTAAKSGTPEEWNDRIAAAEKGALQAIVPALLDRWYTPAFRAANPQAVAHTSRMLYSTDPQGYAGCCAAIRDMDQRDSVRSIAVPSLIVAGKYDPATPPQEGRFLAEQIAQARYIELPTAHLSNMEAPNEFTTSVLKFLTA